MFIALLMHVFTYLSGEHHRPEEAKSPFQDEAVISTSQEVGVPGSEFGE